MNSTISEAPFEQWHARVYSICLLWPAPCRYIRGMTTRFEEPNANAAPSEYAERPTRARYIVLLFLCLLSMVLYLDRVCIAKATGDIRKDLGIEEFVWGFVIGAFTLAYGLFEVPVGRWGDRYGSRGVLTRIVVWWSAFTALTGAAWGLPSLLVMRFLFGAGEAGALPNAARVVTKWFPPESRGWARGIVIASTNVGGALSPVIAGYLIHAIGWRWTFAVFGLTGCIWAAAFHWWFRDDPSTHPLVNAAERRLITGTDVPALAAAQHPPVPWRRVLTSANIWLLGSIVACAAFFSYMYMFWYPNYLEEGRRADKIYAGWLAGLVIAGAGVGALWGGWAAGWLPRTSIGRKPARRIYGVFVFTSSALFLWASMNCDSLAGSAVLMALAAMFSYAQLPTWWSVVAEISGQHLGALFGLMNSMGVVGAYISPIFMGWIAQTRRIAGFTGRDQWDPAFFAYMGILLLGGVLWLFVDATKSAVEEQPPVPSEL